MTATDGTASGDFNKAWKSMTRKYEDTNTVSQADLKKEYYALMMKEDEFVGLWSLQARVQSRL
jgi:hypothetical protein